MTILEKLLRSGAGHAGRCWHRFGHRDQAVRCTEAWEHETFAEEQARWERSDPEYARICEEVRQAKDKGGEASRRADEAKAEWDARVAAQRQATDDAQTAHHALNAEPTSRHRPASSRIESNDSPATGIMREQVRVHDEPAARTARRGEQPATRRRVRDAAIQNPVRDEPNKLGVE